MKDLYTKNGKKNNGWVSVFNLLSLLDIKVSKITVKNELLNHHAYPNLNSLSDFLFYRSIQNESISISKESIHEIPLPAILHVYKKGGFKYTVLDSVGTEYLKYHDSDEGWIEESIEDFCLSWTGVALLVNPVVKIEENGFKRLETLYKFNQIKYWLVFLIIGLVGISIPLTTLRYDLFFFFCLKFIGVLLTTLLLTEDFTSGGRLTDKFCISSARFSCKDVIKSNGSSFLGIGLSELGFVYFCGGFLYLLTSFIISAPYDILLLLKLSCYITIPIVGYSLFYQAFVIKKWCTLCLLLVLILLTELVTLTTYQTISILELRFDTNLYQFLIIYVVVILFWIITKNLFRDAFKLNTHKISLSAFKTNTKIFTEVLSSSKPINLRNVDISLISNADVKIFIVCIIDLSCEKCGEALSVLANTVKHCPAFKLSIAISGHSNEQNAHFKRSFLSAVGKIGERDLLDILISWYANPKKKQRDEFLIPDKNNEDLKDFVKNHEDVINNLKIEYTPAVLINGKLVPRELYDVSDINYQLLKLASD